VIVTTPHEGLFNSKANSSHSQPVYITGSLELKQFQRYFRGTKNLKWVTWRGHALSGTICRR